MKKVKLFIINFFVFFILLFISLIFLEIYLKIFGKNFQISSNTPFYISSYYRLQDSKIDRDGFFDKDGFRTQKKTETGSLILDFYTFHFKKNRTCSIVIISDSSGFGDGRLVNQSWPSLFQEKTKCRVFNFSRNGWSSIEMFSFHDKFLKMVNYDHLIVSLVSNDPHLRGSYDKYSYDKNFHQQKYFIDFLTFKKFPFSMVDDFYNKLIKYSDSIYLIDKTINHFLQKKESKGSLENPPIIDWGYANWASRFNNTNYQKKWREVILAFNKNNKDKNISYFAAIHLNNKEDYFYSSLIDFFNKNEVKYIYCRTEALELMKTMTRKDWANPADGHPGDRNVDYFVDCLKKNLVTSDKQLINKKLNN